MALENHSGFKLLGDLDTNGNHILLKGVSKTSAYTAAGEIVILCDASSGTFIITLPAVASSIGRVYHIKKTDQTENAVTLDGNGTEKIDGALTQELSEQYDCLSLYCDGSAWYII